MSENDTNSAATALPKGAHETFLGLGGIAVLVMVLCLVGYRVFGAQLTAGLDRACAEAAFDAGQKYEAAGNLRQAVLKYRQALDGQFKNDELRHMCGRAVGDLLMRQDRFKEAIEAYEALPPAAFSHAGAYTGYVTALWRAGDAGRADQLGQRWLETAVAESDRTQEIWARELLMKVASSRNNTDALLEHGIAILALAPGNDAALQVARLYRERGQIAEARACLETLLENTDNSALQQAARQQLDQLATGEDSAGSTGTESAGASAT